mmetsp:Transcript_19775/g.35159  ORF Transcript_19775/g.35159 Transcript_19775/m.35159 type:complete len:274 (+) Transcript_19775:296-1117(+)
MPIFHNLRCCVSLCLSLYEAFCEHLGFAGNGLHVLKKLRRFVRKIGELGQTALNGCTLDTKLLSVMHESGQSRIFLTQVGSGCAAVQSQLLQLLLCSKRLLPSSFKPGRSFCALLELFLEAPLHFAYLALLSFQLPNGSKASTSDFGQDSEGLRQLLPFQVQLLSSTVTLHPKLVHQLQSSRGFTALALYTFFRESPGFFEVCKVVFGLHQFGALMLHLQLCLPPSLPQALELLVGRGKRSPTLLKLFFSRQLPVLVLIQTSARGERSVLLLL